MAAMTSRANQELFVRFSSDLILFDFVRELLFIKVKEVEQQNIELYAQNRLSNSLALSPAGMTSPGAESRDSFGFSVFRVSSWFLPLLFRSIEVQIGLLLIILISQYQEESVSDYLESTVS
jgi:hypothetical protein